MKIYGFSMQMGEDPYENIDFLIEFGMCKRHSCENIYFPAEMRPI